MADPVLKPLSSGLPSGSPLLRSTDASSTPGAGVGAARTMTGGFAQDASTVGGLKPDTAAKYAHLPDPIRSLIKASTDGGTSEVL